LVFLFLLAPADPGVFFGYLQIIRKTLCEIFKGGFLNAQLVADKNG
jgi:hypothetical protein